MKKLIRFAVAASAASTLAFAVSAGPANAAQGGNGACVRAGIGTLADLGLLTAAAQKQIDYSTLADPDRRPNLRSSARGFVPLTRPGRQVAHHQSGTLRMVPLIDR